MKTNPEEQKVNISINVSQVRLIKIVLIVVLFSAPLIYLYVKTSGKPDLPKDQPAAATHADVVALENAVKINPTFDNLINLSIAYINNKQAGRSIDYLKKAIELNPQSAVAYNDLGVAYISSSRYQEGIDACNKALQLDPAFQLAKNNLAWGTDERNKLIAIIREQEKTPSDKRNEAFNIELGLNYFKLSDYDKSIQIWSSVFEANPKSSIALNNIGTAFMMKHQYDDAIAMFKKAMELEPDNQLAKNNLAWALDESSK